MQSYCLILEALKDNDDAEYFFNISSDKCTSLKDLVKLYIYNPEQNISTLYIIMKNKHTVRNTFLYENWVLYIS